MKDRFYLRDEQQSDQVTSINRDFDFISEERRKLLKACLDIAILTELTKREALSARDITNLLKINYNTLMSPGTLYPIFYRLERKGLIRELHGRRKKLFVLTYSGKKAMEDFQRHLEEIYGHIYCLLYKE